MSTYRERREAKAQRLREWADKREVKAEQSATTGRQMFEAIPFGQPILIGHHSEGRDRRYRQRAHAKMEQAHEHAATAERMRQRADNIEAAADAAIYSDDPDALDRLDEKLQRLEGQRDRIKRYNASCRKGQPDRSILDERQRRDLASTERAVPQFMGKGGQFPSYVLRNLSGQIASVRKRRDRMQRQWGSA